MTMAFCADPFVRWLLPDGLNYIKDSESYPGVAYKSSFDNGTAFVTEDLGGAALWLAPGDHGDAGSPPDAAIDLRDPDVVDDCAELKKRADAFRPIEPHWYLAMIAVDPAKRGRGYGAALMAHTLKICDQDQVPSYLESTNAANLSFYKRAGYKLLSEVRVGGQKRYPMLRPPQ